ncbi:MAG TPA: GNAT family N-acetyltransferase [Symbiobacteriaceae bacterium]|jgi:GNAT superfamily N-acetyltransferase|nr:GNAT family N-acetyltransferase [Symbiobacteriaceae bacterium]
MSTAAGAITLRPWGPDDYQAVIEIQHEQIDVPQTVEDLQRADQMLGPDAVRHRVAAVTADGLVVGYAGGGRNAMVREGYMQVNIRVRKAWRHQGIGGMLLAEMERFARENQAAVIEASVREEDPAGLDWAKRRGYEQKFHRFSSSLSLATFDPAPWRKTIDDAIASGLRFTSYAEFPQNDESLAIWLDNYWEMNRDTPGIEGFVRPPLEVLKKQLDHPSWDPAGCILALDGDRWAAMAWVTKENDGAFYHNFTGVARDYRGRGLATAVKVVAIEHAKAKGAPALRTHNDSTNQRMLAVNQKMGYQPAPGVFGLEKRL